MEIVYTERVTDYDKSKWYRNPLYFERPEKADKVTIDGDYPEIEEAYRALGVEVVVIGKESKANDADDLTKLTTDELRKRLDEAGIEFDKSAKKAVLIELLRAN